MRYLLLATLALASAACQQAPPATQAAAPAPVATADTTRPTATPKTWPPLPTLFAAADTLTPAMREVLRGNNLATLWQSMGHYRDGLNHFEGFFGPEHYHFALVFTEATRDATDPAVYHIVGKSRYFQSHNIRPFTGTLTLRRLTGLAYPGFLAARSIQHDRAADSLSGHTYTSRARLQLQEEPTENSGLFEGEVVLDFYVVPGQKPDYVHVYDHEGIDDRLPARGAGLLLRGSRRNVSTGQVKSFTVSPDVSAVAPDVLRDFMLDERMGQINPKYARLGWSDFWGNEEWWADSPKPRLSL